MELATRGQILDKAFSSHYCFWEKHDYHFFTQL